MSDDKIIDMSTRKPFKVDTVKSLGFGDITNDDLSGGNWSPEIQAFLESQNLKNLFFSEDWVFITLDLVSDYVSRSPMVVIKETPGEDGKVNEEVIKSHPVLTILQQPNELQGYSQWMYNYCVELDLMGNTIVFYAKQKKNLFIIPAETVVLDFDDNAKFTGYVVSSEGFNPFQQQAEGQMVFKKEEIWHQRRPNPKTMWWGLSPFIPNRKNILFNRYSSDWLNSFYLKGAMPTVALTMDRAVDEKSAMRFLRSFEMAHTGRRNMRRPLVLPKGVSVEALSVPISDQSLPDLIKMNRENILNILRVPKHAVSLAESGSLGSEEHKQALKFFYESAIIPKQTKIQDHLTRKFREAELLEEDERLQFDNTDVEVLREDMIKKAELAGKLQGIWTPNEIRESLWAMEPIEGGDNISFGVSGNRPRGSLSQQVESEPEPQVDEDDPDPDPNDAETLIDDKSLDVDDIVTQSKEVREIAVKAVLEKHSEHLKFRAKQNLEIIESVDKKIQAFWKKLLAEWSKIAQKIVDKELKKAPAASVKALDDDEVPSKIPSKRRLRKLLQNALDESNEEHLDFFIDSFNQVADDSYDVQTDIVTDGDNKEAIQALKGENAKGRKTLLEARALSSFSSISKTQTDAIMNQIEREVKNKTPLRDIGTAIAERFTNITQGKAETIARTEALTAVSIGKQAALKDATKIIGKENLVKVWINLGDLRVRGNPGGLYPDSKADHWVLQGETQEVDEPFSNDLMYPRDVKGPPEETIQCRCDFLMVPREDLESLQT